MIHTGLQKVAIIGAGFAGLAAVVAFASSGWEVCVIERDPPASDGGPDDAFAHWQRQGVAQVRHSHVFLARLTNLLRDHYPDLLAALCAGGCRILEFRDGLPLSLFNDYIPVAGDEDLSFLSSRRVTMELVMRRYVETLANVAILTCQKAAGLVYAGDAVPLKVTGVMLDTPRGEQQLQADLVIDASGRGSRSLAWLRAKGAVIEEETAPAGIIYFTRHYRLRPGETEPARSMHASVGDLDYIKYGVFRADNGWFSLTLAVPEIEEELAKTIRDGVMFDLICAQLPGVAPWTDAARAEPMSPVYALGGLRSHWRHFIAKGNPVALNFFVIGDAAICSNPLYGRGCSTGFLQAHLLAQTCAQSSNPFERALLFDTAIRREIRPYYDIMVKQDAQAIRRARAVQQGNFQPDLRARLTKRFFEDGIRPASRGDIAVMRALMRGFHMLEDPRIALQNPEILLRISRYLLRGRTRNAPLLGPKLGPERKEMLTRLSLQGSVAS